MKGVYLMEQSINMSEIVQQAREITLQLIEEANLTKNNIFVLGLSSSEVLGSRIGQNSNAEIGKLIVQEIKSILDEHGIYLAVQACEHINRSLVVERQLAERNHLDIVNVMPVLKAGGSGATAAYELANDPVVVENIRADAGIDIGDTHIGMHVRFVQVPVRFKIKSIGEAHLSALRSRPKNIGGIRAQYDPSLK